MFSTLHDRVVTIVETLGYPGITFVIVAETVFPPIPSEAILPLAGYMAGEGRFTLLGVVLAATLGSVLGALLLYAAGFWFGDIRLNAFVRRWGRYALLSEDDLSRSYAWFDRHSGAAVLIGRLVPGVRSLISLPAGLTHMPLPRFLLFTALGSLIWNASLVGLGWWLERRWDLIEAYVGYLQYLVICVVLLVAARFIWTRRDALPFRG